MLEDFKKLVNKAKEWDTSYAPKGVELEDVRDDWYDEDGNLIP